MSEKKGFFSRLKGGLTKTRENLVKGIDSLFNGFSEIDDEFYEELEETLIMADLGINVTNEITKGLKEKVKENNGSFVIGLIIKAPLYTITGKE